MPTDGLAPNGARSSGGTLLTIQSYVWYFFQCSSTISDFGWRIVYQMISFNSLRPSDAYICVGNLTIFSLVNDLSPGRCQAIIRINSGISLTRTIGINFGEIFIEIHAFSFNKMHSKMSSGKITAVLSWSQCVKLAVELSWDGAALFCIIINTTKVKIKTQDNNVNQLKNNLCKSCFM